MEEKFVANKITYEINEDDGYYMIGFSDNGDEPDKYVIIQKSINFDNQDIELGMDSYYFEYYDQSNSGYGICVNVEIKNNKVLFELKKNAIENIDLIEISFESEKTISDIEKFSSIFEKIFE